MESAEELPAMRKMQAPARKIRLAELRNTVGEAIIGGQPYVKNVYARPRGDQRRGIEHHDFTRRTEEDQGALICQQTLHKFCFFRIIAAERCKLA